MNVREEVSELGQPVKMADVLGCWQLHEALEERDGSTRANPNLGDNPTGFLHYLPGGRVAVTVSVGGRKPMSVSGTDRRNAPMEELAESARTFDAYAGRFSLISPDQIVHHIEISTYQNDVGTDLVRRIVLDGDFLTLFPPPIQANYPPVFQANGEPVRRWLVWRRIAAS